MTTLDWIVLWAYGAGILAIGFVTSRIIRSSSDLFRAGGESPWWLSGVSGYMTMFSAGTFVVWGGIAFKAGLAAVSICMCYGLSALLVGRFIAGHWKRLGVATPAEFIELRFGRAAVQFYIWLNMAGRVFGMAVMMYALGVMLSALVPLAEGHPLRDHATGMLAPAWSVAICGAVIIAYTVSGGLWAVLMVDVLQFIVLCLSVVFVVPLVLAKAGGARAFVDAAPAGFFLPVAGEFTGWFLAGWVAIHFFKVGAEWAFAQRFICVPDARDARKSAYLFGALYLVTPLFWMLPAMVYRVIDPGANPEQAYILACRSVLPAGMVGMMLAAMFSATASSVCGELNVFAGVLTHDVYRALIAPRASESRLVAAGRLFTVLLGAGVVALAIAVPHLGGAEKVVISVTSLLVGPLVLPTLWGLFSPRVGRRCVAPTALISFVVGGTLRFGLAKGGWLADIPALHALAAWARAHERYAEMIGGILVPFLVLLVIELRSRGVDEGWRRVAQRVDEESRRETMRASTLPARMLAWCTAGCGAMMAVLAALNAGQRGLLAVFAAALLGIGGAIAAGVRRADRTAKGGAS